MHDNTLRIAGISFGTRRSEVQILSPRLQNSLQDSGLRKGANQSGKSKMPALGSRKSLAGSRKSPGVPVLARKPKVGRPSNSSRLPTIRHFRAKNLAYVLLDGQRHYLGPWGSSHADAAYLKLVRKMAPTLKADQIPRGTHLGLPTRSERPTIEVTTVGHLMHAYRLWALEYYRKNDAPTHAALNVRRVAALVDELDEGGTPLIHADAAWLRSFRAKLCALGNLSRGTVNEYVSIIVRAFGFGAEHHFVRREQHLDLQSLPALRKGRPPAPGIAAPKDHRPIEPPSRSSVRRIRRHLGLDVRIMLDLQLLTGMRPNEVCGMRPCHLRRGPNANVLLYICPASHNKTDHVEDSHAKHIWLGPRCIKLLKMLWPKGEDEPFFSPARSEARRRELLAANRSTPHYPSHSKTARTGRRREAGILPQSLGEMYTASTYRKACVRAGERLLAADVAAGVRPAERFQPFTPYQIRHLRGTIIAEREGLKVARDVLGHKNIQTTLRYVKTRDARLARTAIKYA